MANVAEVAAVPSASSPMVWFLQTYESLKRNKWDADEPLVVNGDLIKSFDPAGRESSIVCLFDALKTSTNVRKLSIKSIAIELKIQRALEEALIINSFLETVEMKQVTGVVPPSVFCLANLRDLSLSHCHVCARGCHQLRLLLKRSTILRSLKLESVTFESLEWLASLRSPNSSLHDLAITAVQFDEEAKENLIRSLIINPSITILKLSRLGLNAHHAAGLGSLVSRNRQLQELSLSDNNLNGESVHYIFQAIGTQNRTLATLDLSRNPIDGRGPLYISEGLRSNTTLKTLDLMHCEIWKFGCQTLISQIGHYHGVRSLRMDGNNLEKCVDTLETVLSNHRTHLRQILCCLPTLMGGGKPVWKKIDFYLRLNSAKYHLLQDMEQIPAYLQPYALEPAANAGIDVLFHTFRAHSNAIG